MVLGGGQTPAKLTWRCLCTCLFGLKMQKFYIFGFIIIILFSVVLEGTFGVSDPK